MIGRKLDESETFVGQYSKKYGSRNENGDRLAQFAASNDLFLTNTAFCHPSRHISTRMELSLIETLNEIKTIIIKLTMFFADSLTNRFC